MFDYLFKFLFLLTKQNPQTQVTELGNETLRKILFLLSWTSNEHIEQKISIISINFVESSSGNAPNDESKEIIELGNARDLLKTSLIKSLKLNNTVWKNDIPFKFWIFEPEDQEFWLFQQFSSHFLSIFLDFIFLHFLRFLLNYESNLIILN